MLQLCLSFAIPCHHLTPTTTPALIYNLPFPLTQVHTELISHLQPKDCWHPNCSPMPRCVLRPLSTPCEANNPLLTPNSLPGVRHVYPIWCNQALHAPASHSHKNLSCHWRCHYKAPCTPNCTLLLNKGMNQPISTIQVCTVSISCL